jgi:enoyl-CoA hydratase/carnithine racemase
VHRRHVGGHRRDVPEARVLGHARDRAHRRRRRLLRGREPERRRRVGGLSLACDLTVCSDRARFSAIFAKRGISLDFGTSWLLRQRIGVHRAKELALTARMVPGPEAYDLGLVNRVVPVEELDGATAELADAIAAGPPLALSMTKRELDNAGSGSLVQALETEALAQSVNVGTEDIREALTAYVERRPPEFRGR